MRVKSIRLINFRNYENIKTMLNPKLNIFLGNNAQGKTNLLESIYLAALGKSYKTNRDRELINHRKTQAYIGIEIISLRGEIFIEIKLDLNNKKRVKINRIEINKINEILGNLNVVIFSPEDLKLVKEGPSERREFLDNEISQIKPNYRYNIQKYNNILYQRNKLLKNRSKTVLDTLDIWDEQLADIGSIIMKYRKDFIEKLKNISSKIHLDITSNEEKLEISYFSSIKYSKNLKELYLTVLKEQRNLDIDKGTTSVGIHKDDFNIYINGVSCRNYGSQGQQRTAALSLKLAEVELIKGEKKEYPIILLDDVLSELDIKRRKKLVSRFKDIQTIITSTDDIELKNYKSFEKSTFKINNGKIYKE